MKRFLVLLSLAAIVAGGSHLLIEKTNARVLDKEIKNELILLSAQQVPNRSIYEVLP